MRSLANRWGQETVVGVGDGRQAVDAGAGGDFDAIIMDCQMPGMDGFKGDGGDPPAPG